MQDDRPDQRWLSRLALPVSAGLHVVVVALLIFGLPHSLLEPEKEQAVSVELVPPPEAPPEPKPKVEPPAAQPEVEKPLEKKAEAPPAPSAQQSPIPQLTPVFQYGQKDAGPKKSPDGNSAEEEATPPAEQQTPDEQTATAPDTPAANAAEPLALPDASAIPAPKPAEAAKKPTAAKLREAKRLFSPSATGDPLATTAMGGLPRSARGATLCVTELREQLLRTAPPYFADLLPSYPLGEGTVIDVPDAAFRANGMWRNLGYRCEVDANATKVMSFAFQVGEPVPRSEWRRREFPTR